MDVREMTCIICPVGCALRVTQENGELKVTGNACMRGEAYGIAEVRDPRRTLTTSVYVEGGDMPLASVRSARPMSKHLIEDALHALRGVRLQAPVHIGQVALENAAGSGVDVVVTRNVGMPNE